MSVPSWILELGIPEECVEKRSSAKEKGRKFSVDPLENDIIWRIHVDNCWIRGNQAQRVDYLFWGQSATDKKMVLLIELKGKQFGTALKQIEAMLQHLCKHSRESGIHTGKHRQAPGHDFHSRGGIRVYVILSGGERISRRQKDIERIRQKYGVRVKSFEKSLTVKGLDNLP